MWWSFNLIDGGPSEIRTLGGVTLAGFQDRCIRPTLPKIHICFDKKLLKLEVPPRFELGIAALQAAALPLGDGTSFNFYNMVPGAGLEPAQYCYRGILSPLRLPISPSGHSEWNHSLYNNLKWSGRRGSNSRPQPWQGCALPLSYSRNYILFS